MTKPTNKLLLLGLAMLLALGLGEGLLRLLGARPGVYQLSKEFKVVDSLIVCNNYTVDESGIYKYSSWISDTVVNDVTTKKELSGMSYLIEQNTDIDNLHLVFSDYFSVIYPNFKTSWYTWFKSRKFEPSIESDIQRQYLQAKALSKKDDWQKYIIEYFEKPFNADGFRSIPFGYDSSKGDKKSGTKVLLIGDSYVFGMNARPIHASFADNLLAKGYTVYAAGIPGTDPAQYAAIAQKYVPLLNPDLVIICFYEGNDYMLFDRTSRPNQPHEYLSNAGFYQSAPYGVFMDTIDCYNYYKSLVVIPDTETKTLNRLMSKSAITSLLWGVLLKMDLVKHEKVEESEKKMAEMIINQKPEFTAKHLQSVRATCLSTQTPVLFTIIPQRDDVLNTGSQTALPDTTRAQAIFTDIPFHYPTSLKRKTHYGSNDSHFNTAGHIEYAKFLDSLIQTNSPKSIHY
jgi:hypothetical protein